MLATIQNKNGVPTLMLEVPLCNPPKQTEKMKLIASSGGWVESSTTFEGQPVKVNIMAGFKSDPPPGWVNPKPKKTNSQ